MYQHKYNKYMSHISPNNIHTLQEKREGAGHKATHFIQSLCLKQNKMVKVITQEESLTSDQNFTQAIFVL